jgi:D-arabinose 1-dehydrogenase-like Zn-dependent alcohol dehydrogenase
MRRTRFFLQRQAKIRPMVEAIPLAKAVKAYERMMRNEARFRSVLTMGQ